jgi:hypothetical protein
MLPEMPPRHWLMPSKVSITSHLLIMKNKFGHPGLNFLNFNKSEMTSYSLTSSNNVMIGPEDLFPEIKSLCHPG